MNPYTRPFVVVALLVLSLIPSAAPLRAADSSIITVSPKVRKDVASGERARVLVQLRLPGRGHLPEGRLTHAAASLQRDERHVVVTVHHSIVVLVQPSQQIAADLRDVGALEGDGRVREAAFGNVTAAGEA